LDNICCKLSHREDLFSRIGCGDLILPRKGLPFCIDSFTQDILHSRCNTTIDVELINKINKLIGLINKQKTDDKERIMLSLRWYYKHINQQVEDAFLTLWIAIEILGDCERSNVAKVKNAFKEMYSMDANTAGQTFGIGPIQSIRGSLVHKGKMKTLDKKFIEYLRRIYWDLILYTLDEQCERYSLNFLQIEGIEISQYYN